MYYKHNDKLTEKAKELRRNMTSEERRLWYGFLRIYPVRFLRQKVISSYIVDFYSRSAALVIELDGAQHGEPDAREYDARRTEYLESLGLEVVRIANYDINKNFAAVCDRIDRIIKKRLV